MTVRELIEELSKCDSDKYVLINSSVWRDAQNERLVRCVGERKREDSLGDCVLLSS